MNGRDQLTPWLTGSTLLAPAVTANIGANQMGIHGLCSCLWPALLSYIARTTRPATDVDG